MYDRCQVDYEALHNLGYALLRALGEDPERAGLRETPRRFANWWKEFMEYDPGTLDTCFEHVTADQMVIVSGIRVWSLCEHHLLPFWCDIAIGYIARDRILGLSKFARIAHLHAHKLQLQERLCQHIADSLAEIVGTDDIAVLAQGEHLCMSMRGIRTPSQMTSSVMRGVFREEHETRAEFLQCVHNSSMSRK